MTTRSRGVPAGISVPSWVRHPVAIPVGAALLAVALLCGVAGVAASQAGRTVQNDAQVRVRSNRDAAVRALVRQTTGFKVLVATWAGNGAGCRQPPRVHTGRTAGGSGSAVDLGAQHRLTLGVRDRYPGADSRVLPAPA